MRYKIADCVLEVNHIGSLEDTWKYFKTDEESDIKATVTTTADFCYGFEYIDISQKSYMLKSENSIFVCDHDWKESTIYSDDEYYISMFLEIQLYSYIMEHGALLVHSSLVDYKGDGIMFLGPSGIGKTTQAELWNKYENATILNGDMVFIRRLEDGLYGYGSPWHGSSPYFEKKKVKLKALVMLEQGKENIITKCEDFNKLNSFMGQVFLPYWANDKMTTCLDNIDALINNTPVYHMICRPDEDAVKMLKDSIAR